MGKFRRIVNIDPNEPAAAWSFTLFLTFASVAISVATLVTGSSPGQFLWVFIPFILLVCLAESLPVTLPRGGQAISVSFAIVYAVIILFEPLPAAIIAAVGVI